MTGWRLRLLAAVRARILAGVADYNGYDLTDEVDSDEAGQETDVIMAHLFTRTRQEHT